MPADSEGSQDRLPQTFRPLGVRIAINAAAAALTLVVVVMWFALPPDIRAQFTAFQVLTVIALGGGFYAFGFALARSRVVAREDGLVVVNGYRTRRFEWNEVLSVQLRAGSPWAVLDLSDGTTVAAMGIQGSDGSGPPGRCARCGPWWSASRAEPPSPARRRPGSVLDEPLLDQPVLGHDGRVAAADVDLRRSASAWWRWSSLGLISAKISPMAGYFSSVLGLHDLGHVVQREELLVVGQHREVETRDPAVGGEHLTEVAAVALGGRGVDDPGVQGGDPADLLAAQPVGLQHRLEAVVALGELRLNAERQLLAGQLLQLRELRDAQLLGGDSRMANA